MDLSRNIEVRDGKDNMALVTIADIESILLMYLTRKEQEEFVRSLESVFWELIWDKEIEVECKEGER
jgi:hypothetical protein